MLLLISSPALVMILYLILVLSLLLKVPIFSYEAYKDIAIVWIKEIARNVFVFLMFVCLLGQPLRSRGGIQKSRNNQENHRVGKTPEHCCV